ncbi:MAG: AAA family ATPase [Planctomycetota bacterium]
MSQPHAIIFAAPNGSGRTTLAQEYLVAHPLPYLSADLIADCLQDVGSRDIRLQAGRLFFERIEAQIASRASFLTEVTLAGQTFRRVVDRMRDTGFQISIAFVFLATAQACVARVRERVRKGGHPIPEQDIVRRFSRSCSNFWRVYRPLVDRWHLFYNGGPHFHEVAMGAGGVTAILDETL